MLMCFGMCPAVIHTGSSSVDVFISYCRLNFLLNFFVLYKKTERDLNNVVEPNFQCVLLINDPLHSATPH